MKKLEQIKLGKEAYEKFIISGGDKKELFKIAHIYVVPISEVYLAINNYRKRVIEPRPTIDEENQYKKLVALFDKRQKDFALIIDNALKCYTKNDLMLFMKNFNIDDAILCLNNYLQNETSNKEEEQLKWVINNILSMTKQQETVKKIKFKRY
jgi:hypothetical protein